MDFGLPKQKVLHYMRGNSEILSKKFLKFIRKTKSNFCKYSLTYRFTKTTSKSNFLLCECDFTCFACHPVKIASKHNIFCVNFFACRSQNHKSKGALKIKKENKNFMLAMLWTTYCWYHCRTKTTKRHRTQAMLFLPKSIVNVLLSLVERLDFLFCIIFFVKRTGFFWILKSLCKKNNNYPSTSGG